MTRHVCATRPRCNGRRKSGDTVSPLRATGTRPSVEVPGERRSRTSAEWVVNLGPPAPIASFASSDLDAAAVSPRTASGTPAGLPVGNAPPSPPPARPDLLASIDEDSQLTLRFSKISAFVSVHVTPPGPIERLRRARARAGGAEAPPEEQAILHAVTGEVLPGEVLALMGPSGSGKTSLLSVISGRAPKAVRTQGRVTVNGSKFTKQAKRRVGFVLQDDLLYETLTVEETLGYAAALRLPRGMTKAQRQARVDDVITALGLGKCRGTIIGGYFRRGISGGERKRVSIGHELLINPAILMLDEPTSGLDSTTALHLLQLLQDLAAGGRSIATTIHQPSSRLYQKLDKLMLLADGHVVYYGLASTVLPWFTALGFECPYGVNVADFLLDLAQGEVTGGTLPGSAPNGKAATGKGSGKGQGQKQQAGGGEANGGSGGGGALTGADAIQALWSSYAAFVRTHRGGFTQPQQLEDLTLLLEPPAPPPPAVAVASAGGKGSAAGLEVDGGGAARRGSSAGGGGLRAFSAMLMRRGSSQSGGDLGSDDEEGGVINREITRVFSKSEASLTAGKPRNCCGRCWGGVVRALGTADRGGASYWMQLKVLTLRQLKVRRFESLSGQRCTQLILIAVLTGLFWWQRGGQGRINSLTAAQDIVGLLFFEVLFPAFQALFAALFLFPSEFKMLLRERHSGMYRVSAFYFSTVAADLPMDMVLPALFCICIYLMGGLRFTAAAFFGNILTMVLITLCSQSWGLLLGAVFMNPKTAQTVASVMMLTFMLVGGFYVRDVPIWIRWCKYLSFVFWAFNALLKIEFAGRDFVDCHKAGAATPLQPCDPVPSLQAALGLPTDVNASPALDIGVLAAMLVALRLGVYIALRKKTKAA